MLIDYIRRLTGIEILLLIHMVSNITAIHIFTGWMARYISRQKGYWSSIPPFITAGLLFGALAAFEWAVIISSGSINTNQIGQVAVVQAFILLVLLTRNPENKTTVNEMKEKLDSFPGWRYWFDSDKQSQLISALHVAITRDKADNVAGISVAQSTLILVFVHRTSLANFQGMPPGSPEANYFVVKIFLFSASILALARINRLIFERTMPGVGLMHHGLAHIVRCGNEQPSAQQIRIARWRTPEHRRLFQLADALEKCIYPVRRRVSQADFDTISTGFSALALAVRNEATRFTSEGKIRTEVLSWMCITLATNVNPVQSAKRISALLPNEASMVQPLPQSRVSDALGRVNDILSQNTRIFIALAIIFVVVYYLATGNLARLFGFLESAAVS